MKELQVSVTAEDIAKGKKMSCTDCPIARAVKRTCDEKSVRGLRKIEIAKGYLKLYNRNYIQYYRLLDEAYRFYVAFDEGAVVQPLDFQLELENTLHLSGSTPLKWEWH